MSSRPPEADVRAALGRWEGGLVIGSGLEGRLVALVERATRLALASRLGMRPAGLVARELADMVSDIPDALVRTVAWDQGMGMARHADFTDATGVKACFCDPHSPWQRGTSESANGLIRDCFPKGTGFSKATDGEVRGMRGQLNGRPRQTLGWKRPAEAYAGLSGKAA